MIEGGALPHHAPAQNRTTASQAHNPTTPQENVTAGQEQLRRGLIHGRTPTYLRACMIATYRLQLTPEFGFDAVRDHLPYFRDLRDNLVRINERAITFSDQLLIVFDLFLSKSGFQANEGIKVLTALTAITLPAMVIGTWFGMNFRHMPELHTRFGYPLILLATLTISAAMWWWCKKRRWI